MKLTRKQALEMGLPWPAKPSSRLKRARSSAAKLTGSNPVFDAACAAHGIPIPISEYEFAMPRKWRFDYCWPTAMVALEVQGGIWTHGRHVRGQALLAEHEKLNAAACLGWRVLFCTPAEVESGAVFPVIKAAIRGEG